MMGSRFATFASGLALGALLEPADVGAGEMTTADVGPRDGAGSDGDDGARD
jgi:hypothetical protein